MTRDQITWQYFIGAPATRCGVRHVTALPQENVFSYYHRDFDPVRAGQLARHANWILSRLGLLNYGQYSFAILAKRRA